MRSDPTGQRESDSGIPRSDSSGIAGRIKNTAGFSPWTQRICERCRKWPKRILGFRNDIAPVRCRVSKHSCRTSHQFGEIPISRESLRTPILPQILIVNDCALASRLLGSVLKRSSWSVAFAPTGMEALAELARTRFDAILVDFDMPGMSGLQLLSEIRANYAGIPVVLVTGAGSEEIAAQALRKGAANYVPMKDVVRDLEEVVDSVLSGVQVENDRCRLMECVTHKTTRYVLPNDRSLARTLRSQLQSLAIEAGVVSASGAARFGVAVEEALTNAIIHGNLEVSSKLRDNDDGKYERLIEERLRQPKYADRRVRVMAGLYDEAMEITIADDGPGFNVAGLPDPTDPENMLRSHGRGVILMRTFMDEVFFSPRGNQVRMVKYRPSPPLHEPANSPQRTMIRGRRFVVDPEFIGR